MKVSTVIPVYNEGASIYNNVIVIHDTMVKNNIEHSFVIVNDGSSDDTEQEILRLSEIIPDFSYINLSRNFGKEAAICAGLENANGDAVLVMDSDLQHPPKYIPDMVKIMENGDYDIVECVKQNRGKESFMQKVQAMLYYRLFDKATGLSIKNASDFKLLNKQALDAWLKFKENNTYFRGLSAWLGFKRYELPIQVDERKSGKSKWSKSKLIELAVNSFAAYTAAPLFFVLWLGIFVGIAAVAMTIETLYMYFSHHAQSGFSTVILLQLFIGSGIMISLSIIGLYIAKIYDEVKKRPRYIIKSSNIKQKNF